MSKQQLRSRCIHSYRNATFTDLNDLNANIQQMNNNTTKGIIFENTDNKVSIITGGSSNKDLNSIKSNTIRIGHNICTGTNISNMFVIGNDSINNVIDKNINLPNNVFSIGNDIGSGANNLGSVTLIGNDMCKTMLNSVNNTEHGTISIGGFSMNNIQNNVARTDTTGLNFGFNNFNNISQTYDILGCYVIGNNNELKSSSNFYEFKMIGSSNELSFDDTLIRSPVIGHNNIIDRDAAVVIGNSNHSMGNEDIIIGGNYGILNTSRTTNTVGLNLSIGFENSLNACEDNGIIIGNYNEVNLKNIVIGNYNLNPTSGSNNIILGNSICKNGTGDNNILLGNSIETGSSDSFIVNTLSTDYVDETNDSKCIIRGPIKGKSLGIGVNKMFYDTTTKQVFYSID